MNTTEEETNSYTSPDATPDHHGFVTPKKQEQMKFPTLDRMLMPTQSAGGFGGGGTRRRGKKPTEKQEIQDVPIWASPGFRKKGLPFGSPKLDADIDEEEEFHKELARLKKEHHAKVSKSTTTKKATGREGGQHLPYLSPLSHV